MPNPIEGLLEVCEDIVEVLLVLETFLPKDSSFEDLLCSAPSCCEACLSSAMILSACGFSMCGVILSMTLMAGEADRSVVLVMLQVAFLGKCDD